MNYIEQFIKSSCSFSVVRSGDYYLFEGDPEEDDEEVENLDEPCSKKITTNSSEDTVDRNISNNITKKGTSESNDIHGIMMDAPNNPLVQTKHMLKPISENRISGELARKSLDSYSKTLIDNREMEAKEMVFSNNWYF